MSTITTPLRTLTTTPTTSTILKKTPATSSTYICSQCRHATLLRRPKRPYTFTQLITLSDGSTFTHRTTSPMPVYRSTRDTRNSLLWNPSSNKLLNVEEDEAGRLAAFRAKFGRTWDANTVSEEGKDKDKDGSGKKKGGDVNAGAAAAAAAATAGGGGGATGGGAATATAAPAAGAVEGKGGDSAAKTAPDAPAGISVKDEETWDGGEEEEEDNLLDLISSFGQEEEESSGGKKK